MVRDWALNHRWLLLSHRVFFTQPCWKCLLLSLRLGVAHSWFVCHYWHLFIFPVSFLTCCWLIVSSCVLIVFGVLITEIYSWGYQSNATAARAATAVHTTMFFLLLIYLFWSIRCEELMKNRQLLFWHINQLFFFSLHPAVPEVRVQSVRISLFLSFACDKFKIGHRHKRTHFHQCHF